MTFYLKSSAPRNFPIKSTTIFLDLNLPFCNINPVHYCIYINFTEYLNISLYFLIFRCISLYFTVFLSISLYFFICHCISLYLTVFPYISLYFVLSHYISEVQHTTFCFNIFFSPSTQYFCHYSRIWISSQALHFSATLMRSTFLSPSISLYKFPQSIFIRQY